METLLQQAVKKRRKGKREKKARLAHLQFTRQNREYNIERNCNAKALPLLPPLELH